MRFSPEEHNTYLEHTNFSPPRAKVIADLLESLIIAALICAFIYIFVFTPNIVHGPSMLPTFREGQLVLTTSRIAHWMSSTEVGKSLGLDYNRGDIIVFHTLAGEDLIKRVIGMPGDTIEIIDGKVYISGEQADEEYLDTSVVTQGGTFLAEGEEIVIPEGYFFAMGDNRRQSRDSRDSRVGLVDREDVLGKVILRYWPISDFGPIGTGEVLI